MKPWLKMMTGQPVGHSKRDIDDRHAFLAASLLTHFDPVSPAEISDAELVWKWVNHHDARNFVVLGDPAVRLRNERMEASP